MATYKGNDIAKPDQDDEALKLRGGRLPGMENVEEELSLPESNEPDYQPRPGQKGYKGSQHMADNQSQANYAKFASDPERWSKLSREGPDVGSLSPSSQASQYSGPNTTRDQWSQPPQPKKGSFTVPKMCAGGKVLKTWR